MFEPKVEHDLLTRVVRPLVESCLCVLSSCSAYLTTIGYLSKVVGLGSYRASPLLLPVRGLIINIGQPFFDSLDSHFDFSI